MFHIGQKVVLVDDSWHQPNWHLIPNKPIKGEVYTIRAMYMADRSEGHMLSFLLEEIQNPPVQWHTGKDEGSFPSYRFRPLVEKKTDISTLIALLNPVNHKKLEDA